MKAPAEFSRLIAIEGITPDKTRQEKVEATAAECAALAKRFDLRGLENFKADLSNIEQSGMAVVTLAGRPFTIRKQFLDDVRGQRLLHKVEVLRRALLVFHAPRDLTVGIENAAQIFQAAKHPKSFISLDDADHLLSRQADAVYVADVLSAWASRYIS